MESMQTTTPVPAQPVQTGSPKKNTKLWLAVIIVALVVIGGIAWAAVTFYNQNQSAEQQSLQQDGPLVGLEAAGLDPATIKVKVGQDVTWVNNDTKTHKLMADEAALPSFSMDEPLGVGDYYSYTFETAGTYTYYDEGDPTKYVGTVVVE